MAVHISWPRVPGLAKLKRPPVFLFELALVVALYGFFSGVQLQSHGQYVKRGALATATPYFEEARRIIELHWTLYGRFPDDLYSAVSKPGLSRWKILELLDPDSTESFDGQPIAFEVRYLSSGRLVLSPLDGARAVPPSRIDFVPEIVGQYGARKIVWRCYFQSDATDTLSMKHGWGISSAPAWCKGKDLTQIGDGDA